LAAQGVGWEQSVYKVGLGVDTRKRVKKELGPQPGGKKSVAKGKDRELEKCGEITQNLQGRVVAWGIRTLRKELGK